VIPDHTCFSDPEQNRKVGKNRFGEVLRAQIEVGNGGNPIGKMLRAHQEDAQKWILRNAEEWEAKNPDPDETEDEGDAGDNKEVNLGLGVTAADEDSEMVVIEEIVSSRMPVVVSM
jgi:histone deacetylase 6